MRRRQTLFALAMLGATPLISRAQKSRTFRVGQLGAGGRTPDGLPPKPFRDALQTLGMSAVVLLTPYKSNKAVIDYLTAAGVTVVADVALKLEAKDFGSVTPQDWARLARENDRPDADGIFLSCTNTTQIEAIADIERELGKPVVNSNQAVLWGCMRRLRGPLSPLKPMPQLGRLMQSLT